MAEIRPFKAVRPNEELAHLIAALPYDVYNRKEATELVHENPLSFLAIDRAETSFDLDINTYDEVVYENAKQLLEKRIFDGIFIEEEEPCFYLYALTMNGRCQHGFVGCALADDYDNNIIKKHENTRADKERDRIRHIDTTNMQTGPIFLAYRQTKILSEIIGQVTSSDTLYSFMSDDGIIHQVWKITKDCIMPNGDNIFSLIYNEFKKMNSIYIADGHHRCASAVRVAHDRRNCNPNHNGNEEYNYFLSVLFPQDELLIMDYNRVIKNNAEFDSEHFLSSISEYFDVSVAECSPYKPSEKGEFGLYFNKIWYKLIAKNKCYHGNPVDDLDVSILQNYVFEPLFGIKDPKTDNRIDFIGGIRGLKELERRCEVDSQMAFSLYPTSIEELFSVADAGLLMPPKSTWFEPKLRSGLFLHRI